MAQTPFDNIQLLNFGCFKELAYRLTIIPDSNIGFVVGKFGKNTDIDANVEEDVWDAGGTMSYLTSAETVDIASDSVEDDPVKADESAGTGAHAIRIYGLDNDYNMINEDVTLNGTGTVSTTNQYLRIYRAYSLTSGTAGSNVGNITLTADTAGYTMAQIIANFGQTQMSHYTIPAGYTGYVTSDNISVYRTDGTSERQGEVHLRMREFGGSWRDQRKLGLRSGAHHVSDCVTIILPEKSDFKYIGNAAANNTTISVTWSMVVMNNDYL